MPTGSTLLVAVSGGADSTALLAGLHSIAHEFGLLLHAAHLHHGLRGEAADADLEAVRALCGHFEVPLTSARRDARRVLAERGWSGEAGLRRLRRGFLLGAARRARAVAIVTAHTADDQLETLLLRLARGAGLRGLGGMRDRAGGWIKPLLAATRADIEADLNRAGLAWREDATNASRDFARNRIRHDVVPALVAATGNTRPGLARRASRTAAEVRAADRVITAWARRRLARISRFQPGEVRLDSRGVAPYPSAARRIVLRLLWDRLTGGREGLTHQHVAGLFQLIDSGGPGSEVRLPGGYRAIREAHEVLILPGPVRKPAGTGARSTECIAQHEAHEGATET
ncbi:MAG: tRNA lysidine(34) synthetase TilS [Candidatus Eisenbacteria bacterium]